MASSDTAGLSIPVPAGRRLYWALFLNSQLLIGALYVAFTAASAASLRLVAYAALWINGGVWVVVNSRPDLTAVSTRTHHRALLVATGYFAALAVAGGLVGAGIGDTATGLRIADAELSRWLRCARVSGLRDRHRRRRLGGCRAVGPVLVCLLLVADHRLAGLGGHGQRLAAGRLGATGLLRPVDGGVPADGRVALLATGDLRSIFARY